MKKLIIIAMLFVFSSFTLADDELKLKQKVPEKSERKAVGSITKKIERDSSEFKKLVKNNNSDIVFQDDDDRYMTKKLDECVNKLAKLVKQEWHGKKLRITEGWDNGKEHSEESTHYEARAVDITISDRDKSKLGRLGKLAVDAGFGWVYYEDSSHIHASVSR